MEQLYTFPNDALSFLDTVVLTVAFPLHAEAMTSDKDAILFKNALDKAEKLLEKSDIASEEQKAQLQAQIERIRNDERTLVSSKGALVMYVSPEDIYYYHLGLPVDEVVQLDTKANLLPLTEYFQYTNDFDLLVLNQEDIRFFHVTGDVFSEVDLKEQDEDAPQTKADALGTELDGGNLNYGTYNRGGATGAFYHGHQETSQEKDIDRENYFRAVDEYIYRNYSNPEQKPLMLFALDENQAVYRDITSNEHLLEVGVSESGANLADQEIKAKTLDKLEQVIQKEREVLVERFQETSPEFRVDNHLEDLAVRANEGRIEELVLQKGYEAPGTMDEMGRYDAESDANDVIHQIVDRVLMNRGKVFVLDADHLPDDIQITARMRY